MKFWDSSAIIPLCVNEPYTPLVRKTLENDASIICWWSTIVECQTAFARLRRENVFTRTDEAQARHLLNQLASGWTELAPSKEIREHTSRVLLLHPLRAADSLQLAAALVWAKRKITGSHFVCLDTRLREAAKREGFTVLPESL